MERIYGIAAALYGESPRRMTTSVVSGETKNQITLETRKDYTFDNGSKDTIAAGIQELIQITETTAHYQRTTNPDYPVPVVFAAATGFRCDDLYLQLQSSFPTQLENQASLLETANDPQAQTLAATQGITLTKQKVARELIHDGIQTLLQNSVHDQSMLQLQPWDYNCAQDLCGLEKKERTMRANKLITSQLREKYEKLLAKVLNGQEEHKPGLDQAVREIAVAFAQPYKQLLMGQPMSSRFVSAATTTDLSSEGDIRNFILPNLDLRQIYGAAFMEELQINHNICIKCSLDPQSRPFGDVTATFIADHMDKRDSTKPSVVLLKN